MTTGRRSLMFGAGSIVGVLLLFGGLFLAQPAAAVEPICPGGSSPRSDITWCSDFEVQTDCPTGLEPACWLNNGFNIIPPNLNKPLRGWKTAFPNAAVGSRDMKGVLPQPGGTGVGYAYKEPIQPTRFLNINYRYYVRYSDGFISFASGHGPSPLAFKSDFTTCATALKFQSSTYSGQVHYDGLGGCGGGLDSSIYPPNQGTFTPLLNNRWYVVEVQALLDTSCSNQTTLPWSGCNGVIRVWIDGVLTHQYTGLNLGGAQAGLSWYKIGFGTYYHAAFPSWSGTISFDNIAVSNTGTFIGCANTDGSTTCPGNAENARGTGDTSSPYGNISPYIAWLGRQTAQDCTQGGYLGPYGGQKYRSGGSLSMDVTHGTYQDGCVNTVAWLPNIPSPYVDTLMAVADGTTGANGTACTGGGTTQRQCRWNGSAWVFTSATDNALKINLTSNSDGGGVLWERGDSFAFTHWAQHGWIYLPSSNNYSVTNLALTGFTNSATTPAAGYVALTISSGNWAVGQKDTGGTSGTVSTSTPVTFDTWHEYELMLWNDNTVSLMIDRVRLLNRVSLPRLSSWAFGGTAPVMVIGVIDFQGTAPFTAYFDDNGVATVSFWSCDGWGNASCPFGGRTTISAPTNLTVR